MTNQEAIEILKPLTEYSVNENGIGTFPIVSTPLQVEALDFAIKALENSSQIIDALEKLKDETLDGIVKFGIEKSIECVKKIMEENA